MVTAAGGQFASFGKNKVQYAEFEWQKMESEHFDIYFFAEEEKLATYAAQMAERHFADLEKKFAHTVQRRVPLVFYSSHIYFEQTNIIPNLLPEGVDLNDQAIHAAAEKQVGDECGNCLLYTSPRPRD